MAQQPHDRAKAKHNMRTQTRPNNRVMKKQETQQGISHGNMVECNYYFEKWFFGRRSFR